MSKGDTNTLLISISLFTLKVKWNFRQFGQTKLTTAPKFGIIPAIQILTYAKKRGRFDANYGRNAGTQAKAAVFSG